MKRMVVAVLAVAVVTAAGCTSQGVHRKGASVPAVSQAVVVVQPLDAGPLRRALAEAAAEQAAGNTEGALRIYATVLDEYSSPGGELETAVATNAALAALDAGDRSLFMRYAEDVERYSANLRHVGTNTQVVLSLLGEFRGSSPQSGDARIQSAVAQGVTNALGKGRD